MTLFSSKYLMYSISQKFGHIFPCVQTFDWFCMWEEKFQNKKYSQTPVVYHMIVRVNDILRNMTHKYSR